MILALAIALAAAKVLDADDLNVLGNFIVAVGSLMLTAAAQEQVLSAERDKSKEDKEKKDADKELNELKEKVAQLVKKQGDKNGG